MWGTSVFQLFCAAIQMRLAAGSREPIRKKDEISRKQWDDRFMV